MLSFDLGCVAVGAGEPNRELAPEPEGPVVPPLRPHLRDFEVCPLRELVSQQSTNQLHRQLDVVRQLWSSASARPVVEPNWPRACTTAAWPYHGITAVRPLLVGTEVSKRCAQVVLRRSLGMESKPVMLWVDQFILPSLKGRCGGADSHSVPGTGAVADATCETLGDRSSRRPGTTDQSRTHSSMNA